MMESFFPRGWPRSLLWERPFMNELALPFEGKPPRVDVVDRDAEILMRAEVPGADKAKTTFKDGVLELTLPKVAKSKRHTIKLD